MPRSWKQSTIMPIAKIPGSTKCYDFRPVALISISLRNVWKDSYQLIKYVANRMDLTICLQSQKRRTGRNTSFVQFNCQSSRDFWNTVRVLVMAFSLAFNTMQTHVLIKKLLNLEVNPHLILWIRQLICDRPQRVILNGPLCRDPVLSDEIVVNTGTPQGCVLSPILFSIYTNDISFNNSFIP